MSAPVEFTFEDPKGQRFQAAMELLSDGKSVVYRGISLRLIDANEFDLAVIWTPTVGNLDEERAREVIASAERDIEELKDLSPDFARIVKRRSSRCSIILWDGMSYSELCRLEAGRVVGLDWTV